MSRSFGAVHAVEQMDFHARAGKVTALIGPNGAGKTTLLLMLASLLAPDGGTISVGGLDPARHRAEVRSRLGWMPLFSIVMTYLAVAGLAVGTLIAFGLGTGLAQGTVLANNAETERVAWLLAMNPYVVVADAIPYPDRTLQQGFPTSGAIEGISQGARYAPAGPEGTYPCANGAVQPAYLGQKTPLWPLGLGLQLALPGLLMWLGWSALRTPARRLARGTRIA